MSKYEMIKELKGEEFRRLTGVKRETFEIMLEELKKNLSDKEEKELMSLYLQF